MNRSNAVFSSLSHLFAKKFPRDRNGLIQKEIQATKGMFASTPGHDYDFFYYGQIHENAQEWILHDWFKEGRDWHVVTTRYLVQPHKIYRTQEGQPYQEVTGDELERFRKAIELYYAKVRAKVYG